MKIQQVRLIVSFSYTGNVSEINLFNGYTYTFTGKEIAYFMRKPKFMFRYKI